MNEKKWTPGPWVNYDDSASPVHRHQIAALGKTIAHIYCTNGMEQRDAANANLMAAAPELYEALEAIITSIGYGQGVNGAEWKAAKEAMAKARGEQQ